MENLEPTERHKQLSLMFLKMGRSLVDEGLKNKDYETASLGNSMIFMASIIFDRNDVKLFSELCSMMSSRKLVKGITNGTLDFTKLTDLKDISTKDTFQEIIRRIKRDLDNDDSTLNEE